MTRYTVSFLLALLPACLMAQTNTIAFNWMAGDTQTGSIFVSPTEHENCEGEMKAPELLADLISGTLLEYYDVLERGALNTVLEEQQLQLSGVVSGETIIEAGELTGADGIVLVSEGCVDGEVTRTVKLVDCRTAKTLWQMNCVGTQADELLTSLEIGMTDQRSFTLTPDGFEYADEADGFAEEEEVSNAGPRRKTDSNRKADRAPEFDEELEYEERRGFGIAANVGVYFANKFTANLYNGSCALEILDDPQGVRCYTIAERLSEVNIQDLQYIQDFYGATGVTFPSDMNPLNMRYNPSVVYGLNVSYYFNDFTQLSFNLNQIRLKAQDQFTLIFQGTGQQLNGQTDTRLFPITGEEQRLHITGGLRQAWEINDGIVWYLEGGGSMVSAKVISNTVRVADRNFELFLGAQNPQQIVNFTPRARTGFGWYAETGVSLVYNDAYRIDLGLIMSKDRIRLESFDSMDFEGKQRLSNWAVYLRFGI